MAARGMTGTWLALALWSGVAAAEDTPSTKAQAVTTSGVVFMAPRHEANPNAGLNDVETGTAAALALHWHHPSGWLAVGGDLNTYEQSFDSATAPGERLVAPTVALSGQVLLTGMTSRLGVYAGGGAGVYLTDLLWDNGRTAASDTRFGRHVVTGAAVRVIEDYWLVVESRRVYAEADLGPNAGGTLDIGGTFLYFGIQFVRRDAVPARRQTPE